MTLPGASPDRHRVLVTEDHESFAVRAAALFDADPVGTNVLGTILAGVRAGRMQPPGSFWLIVMDGAERPLGAAVRTSGFPLFLAPMPEGAAPLIAGALHRAGHDVAAVRGDAAATQAFVTRWRTLTGCDVHRTSTEGVHLLDTLTPPVGVPGAARPATPDDAELAAAWYAAFEAETHHHDARLGEGVIQERAGLFVRRLSSGQVLLWTDGGAPVSLAGWQLPGGPAERTIGRVGPVYTPGEHRRRGYAAAVTAAATQAVLDSGARGVMLYTDLANPTSNGVYARLGYRRIADASGWTFAAPAGVATARA